MPESLSPLSEAKAQLSLKTVALEKHYKQELKTIETELSAINEKKQLLEAKRETVRCKIKEIADLGDRGANNALANIATAKTTKKYDLEPFLPDTNAIEKAVREVHLQRDAAKEKQMLTSQLKKYTHNKEFNNVDALKETETPDVTFSFDGLDDDDRQLVREEVAKVKAEKCDRDVADKTKKIYN